MGHFVTQCKSVYIVYTIYNEQDLVVVGPREPRVAARSQRLHRIKSSTDV